MDLKTIINDHNPEALIPLERDSFVFACHSKVTCFNVCCADLNLMLTPYDVLRMKKHLKVPSEVFLDDYTTSRATGHHGLPMAFLRMKDDGKKRCPFVTDQGCSIYEDRPGACRMYPLGRAATKPDPGLSVKEQFFFVKEAHCTGFGQGREWTVAEWQANQGLTEYNFYNDLWMEIITRKVPGPQAAFNPQKFQMFVMASYNLDEFRRFVLGSRFLTLFDLPADLAEKVKTDDLELLKLGMNWLRFSLFGDPTLVIKDSVIKEKKAASEGK
ncbi:MAG: YkgJ family cysteine cluster protein [Deltaproteobacteria bacterium]|nr:YkgJ family cysteine cluster protein [Deltaproteobacteria bacterium]